MATNVPAPVYGPAGFTAPDEQDVLTGRLADLNSALGGGINLALSTPQGQLASSDSAIIGDTYALFLWLMNMVDPAFSEGRMQDVIGRFSSITRVAARATIVTATCVGLVGTVIPTGALAQAVDGTLYACQGGAAIPIGGSIDLSFACQTLGPIDCPAHTLTTVYQAVPGWDTIDNAAAGTPGQYVEGRASFEARRRAAVGWQATGPLGALRGAVLAVPEVLDVVAVDNLLGYALRTRGVVLAANGIYIAVLGGKDEDIALAILQHKAPGVNLTGNTAVTIADPSSQFTTPNPTTYTIRFERPTTAAFFMRVAISSAVGVPTDAQSQVAAAVVPVFAGTTTDAARERIGGTVYASRYYPIIEALGDWAQRLVSITLGYGTEASFIGAVSGVVLTVSSVSVGALKIGQILQDDAGLTDGMMIIGFGTGSGGAGTYQVSPPGFVATTAIRVLRSGEKLELLLNEAPVLAAADVKLVIE